MRDLAVLTPVVLLLLMVLLGRLERWLDESAPPPPPRPERRRWRQSARPVRSPASVEAGAGRRLARRARWAARRRPAVAQQVSVPAPRAGRRQLLGGRLRSGR